MKNLETDSAFLKEGGTENALSAQSWTRTSSLPPLVC